MVDLDLRSVIDGMSEGFALLDADFVILDVNAETMRLEPRSRDEIVGRCHWDVYPGSADSELGMLYKKAMRDRVPVSLEHRHEWEDGRVSWLDMRAFPVSGERLAVFFRDVTAATEARLQLARNAETFQILVIDNPFGIYVVDSQFRMLHVSQGCGKAFAGIEPLLGRDFADIMQIVWEEPFAAEAIGRFRHTLTTGESYQSPPRIESRRNIEAREAYDWSIDRIVLPDGQFGVVCYFYDLSERLKLEAELHQALDDKDTLVREIDHRIRNSLSIVSSLLTMQGRAAQSSEVKQALTAAAARMQAVARIHERLYKGNQVGSVQFDEYLLQICDDLRNSVGRKGVHLQLDVVPVRLEVDHAVSLGLVTAELVTNAFKHCTGDDVTIRLTLMPDADGCSLSVEDDGAGMPLDFVAGTGTGLGMRVVKLLTRQVGATIQFPAPGEAANFKVCLPSKIIVPASAP